MILYLDIWLFPAIAAGSASYLVSLLWERFRKRTAPSPVMAAYLAVLSFIMGAVCAYYRHTEFAPSLENNVIVMFTAGASTTFFYLLLLKYIRK
jgi:cytochrome c553